MTAMALVFFFLASVGSSSAAVYTVGGTKGWTVMSPPNYTALAAMETFHVGDTVLFVYNKQYHNVVEVEKSGYDVCTATAAIATYATGNDSLTIKTPGMHYFLCGVVNHCILGQKVEIFAAAHGPSAMPAPTSNAAATCKGPAGLPVLFSLLVIQVDDGRVKGMEIAWSVMDGRGSRGSEDDGAKKELEGDGEERILRKKISDGRVASPSFRDRNCRCHWTTTC